MEKMTRSLLHRPLRNRAVVVTSVEYCKVSCFGSAVALLLKGHSNSSWRPYSWHLAGDIFSISNWSPVGVLLPLASRLQHEEITFNAEMSQFCCVQMAYTSKWERGPADSLASWSTAKIPAQVLPYSIWWAKWICCLINIVNYFAEKNVQLLTGVFSIRLWYSCFFKSLAWLHSRPVQCKYFWVMHLLHMQIRTAGVVVTP